MASINSSGPLALSPGGTAVAAPNSGDIHTATNIYDGTGTLVGTALGQGAGWLDDTRLLVQTYPADAVGNPTLGIAVCDLGGA